MHACIIYKCLHKNRYRYKYRYKYPYLNLSVYISFYIYVCVCVIDINVRGHTYRSIYLSILYLFVYESHIELYSEYIDMHTNMCSRFKNICVFVCMQYAATVLWMQVHVVLNLNVFLCSMLPRWWCSRLYTCFQEESFVLVI